MTCGSAGTQETESDTVHHKIEMALWLWAELTLRRERHCVVREERLVEVPHDLKQPETTMRGNGRVQMCDDEDEERCWWVTHRLLHAHSGGSGVEEGAGDLLVKGRTRLHVKVSGWLQAGL